MDLSKPVKTVNLSKAGIDSGGVYAEFCTNDSNRFLNIWFRDHDNRAKNYSSLTPEGAKILRDTLIEIYPLDPQKSVYVPVEDNFNVRSFALSAALKNVHPGNSPSSLVGQAKVFETYLKTGH